MPDIYELMARDPLTLTRDDLTAIITEIRSKRKHFDSTGLKATMKPATPKQKQLSSLAAELKLDL